MELTLPVVALIVGLVANVVTVVGGLASLAVWLWRSTQR